MKIVRFAVPVLAAFAITPALAQGPGGGPPPALMAKLKAWTAWRDNHKNIQKLTTTLFGLRDLEKEPATAATKDQAKQLLAVLNEWKNKPVMTDEQAQQVNRKISNLFTSEKQIKVLATAKNPMAGGRGFGGGARPGGGPAGGGAGARPAGGGMAAMDPTKFPDPKDYNPLNPDSSPFKTLSPDRFAEMKGKWNEYITLLEKRSK